MARKLNRRRGARVRTSGVCVRNSGLLGALAVLAVAAGPAIAQDVTGIANADVRAGYRSLSLRMGYLTPDDGKAAAFGAQVGAQANLSERFSVQGAAIFTKIGDGRLEFRGAQTQLQWQFAESESDHGVDGSLILVARIPDGDDGPGRTGLVAAGKWTREDWEARLMVAALAEIGDRARAGVMLAERAEITRRVGALGRIGLQATSSFNTTAHFGAFKDQSHQAGPVLKTLIGRRLQVTSVALFGASEAAPDVETKLFLTYEF